MSKKPASLTSDLLARKGEAEPSPIDPSARMSLFAGPDYGTAGGTGGADEEERPRPPEPEIIYTAEETSRGGGGTRLVIGAVLGAIVIGGILLTLSGKNQQSVAPIAPEIAAQGTGGEEAPGEPSASATNESAPAMNEATPQMPAPEAAPAIAAAPSESAPPSPAPAASMPAAPVTAAEAPAPSEPTPALRPGSEAAAPAAPVAETPAPAVAEPAKAPAAQATPAKAVSKGAYVVQISALRDEKSARTAWRTLVKQFPGVLGGHALDIEKADLGAKGTWYRVRAAGFETKAAAAKACAALKAKGQGCMVKKR